jgi:glycosyltransferase involved in cell wall biosynthesis
MPFQPNRKILLVSYQFPPAGGVAVQRILSLAKYLPKHGYEVHVLCCRNPGIPEWDSSLLRHIPAEVKICRTFSPELPFKWRKRIWRLFSGRPGKTKAADAGPAPEAKPSASSNSLGLIREAALRLFCPDPEVVWIPFALRQARRLIRRHNISTVLVTAPPFSSFSIGVRLKQQFPGLRFVADYRDDWLGYYLKEYDVYKSSYMRRRAAELERELVESADLVVCTTRMTTDALRGRYPEQDPKKISCIYNGYDAESFADLKPRSHGTRHVVVTFIGTLHKVTSARYYLSALDALPEAVRSRFETRFIGRVAEDEAVYLDNCRSSVKLLGFMAQREAFRYIAESDYLLTTVMYAGSIAAKVFEYLAVGKPILLFGPRESEMARLLAMTGAGWCVDPADDPAVTSALLGRLALARDNPESVGFKPNWDVIRKYERSYLAGEYGRLISELWRTP